MITKDQALEDVLILDLTDEKGMYAGKLLADMGARVILVENPEQGHAARGIGPYYNDVPDINGSLLFWYHSTNKESCTIDISKPEGQQLLKALVKKADILLESFQPGYMESLGLGYKNLAKINDKLIMTSITGFGQYGPYSNYLSSNLVSMAMGGIMASCGYDDIPDSPPIHCEGWQGYATGCNYAAIGTLAALYYRDITGQGQWVDASIHEALSCTTEAAMPNWFYTKQTPKRQTGRHHGIQPTPSTQYVSLDGKLINGFDIPPRTMERWNALLSWMKETNMEGDLENDSYRELIRNRVRTGPQVLEIVSQITKFIASLPAEEIYHGAQKIRLAWAIIRSPEENLNDPHFTEDRNFFVDIYHPNIGKSFLYPGAPYSFTETPWNIRHCAPELGENTNRVLIEDLGLYEEKVNNLRESGIV